MKKYLLILALICSSIIGLSDTLSIGEYATLSDGTIAMVGQATLDHLFVRGEYGDIGILDNVLSFQSGELQTVWLWLDDDQIYLNEAVQALPPTLVADNAEPYNEITYNSLQFDIYLPEGIEMVEIANENGDLEWYVQGDRMPNSAESTYGEVVTTKVVDGITYRVYRMFITNKQINGTHFSSKNAKMYRENGALKKDDAPLLAIFLKNNNQNVHEGRLPDIIIANQEFGFREAFIANWEPNEYRFFYGKGGNNESQRLQYYNRVALYGSDGFFNIFEYNGIYYKIIDENSVLVTYRRDNTYYTGTKMIPSTVEYNGKVYDVVAIGDNAFQNCTELSGVTMPNTVTTIGDKAFFGCRGLTNITIPNAVTNIGNYAFQGCWSLNTLHFNANNCADFSSVATYRPFYNLSISTIDIGNGVQRIPAYFATGFNNLTSISIPSSVTSIGYSAFANCTSLTELNFNATYCADFDTSLPFSNSFITTVHVGNSTQKIPANFVRDLTTLRTVTIGNSVTTIGTSAFSGCTSMTDVSIGNSVTTIGNSAFYNCTGLNNVIMGNSVTTINNSAFYGCKALRSIVLPSSVRIIRSKAFYNCSGLLSVYSYADDPPVMESSDCFNCYNTATLYVPYEVLNIYKNTYYWNNFYRTYGVDAEGNVLATGISLNVNSKSLNVNQTYKLIATVTPDVTTNKTVNWSTSNPSVATVDSEGLVTGIAAGTATITATTTDGTNLSATCEVTVSIIPVTHIQLNKTSITLDIGDVDTYQLTATITPNNATYQTLEWSSSNPAVATVSDNGLVFLVSPGVATITATTTDGTNLSASCQVTVIKRIKNITLNESSLTLTLHETAQLTAIITPSDAVNQVLNWTSSNTSVATVDNNGFITSKGVGTTTIKATTTDGSNLSANCSVQVLPDYYLTLDTLSHIRGESARVKDMQVSLINKNLISGIQFDVTLPTGVEFNLVDGMPDVTLDDARATRSHSIATSQLSNGKHRVLVTSSTSKDLKGHDGVLVHMNLLLPQMHNTGDAYVNISNIIASEADETGHTLNNTSAPVRFYYIVGDADANAVVDIADHTATASKILGRSPSPFYYDAANVDGNSSLNVVDLVGITNIALEIRPITVQQAPAVGFVENRLFCDKLKLNAYNEAEIKVGMDCAFDFAGFQMDVTMPQGLALVDATLGEKASKLGLVTEVLPDGKIRILGTSFSDAEVDGACPQLLTLKVKAERNYMPGCQIEFSDILFAQRDLTSHCFDGLNVEYVEQSSVYELMNEARIYIEDGNIIVNTPVAGTVQIIAVDGRMVEYQAQVGRNVYVVGTGGIYVVNFNGKTIKVGL